MKNMYSIICIFLSALIATAYMVLQETSKTSKTTSEFLKNPSLQNEVTPIEQQELFVENTTAAFYYYQ